MNGLRATNSVTGRTRIGALVVSLGLTLCFDGLLEAADWSAQRLDGLEIASGRDGRGGGTRGGGGRSSGGFRGGGRSSGIRSSGSRSSRSSIGSSSRSS